MRFAGEQERKIMIVPWQVIRGAPCQAMLAWCSSACMHVQFMLHVLSTHLQGVSGWSRQTTRMKALSIPVHAGNGSQWAGMARELLGSSPAFAAGVRACAGVVEPLGLDLLGAFAGEAGWGDPVLAAVGLASVQVGASSGPYFSCQPRSQAAFVRSKAWRAEPS